MRRRVGRFGFLVAACAGLAAQPRGALAYHTEEMRLTDGTAHVPERGELRLGLWKAEWTPISGLSAGSYTWPWLLRAANLHLKYEHRFDASRSVAPRAGLLRFAVPDRDDDGSAATLYVVPVELWGSWRFHPRWTWSLGGVYTKVSLQAGGFDDDDLGGAAALTNLQAASTIEWRVTRVTALVLHGRMLAFQEAAARARSVTRPDEFTTIEVVGGAEADVARPGSSSLLAAAAFSWKTFNLRIGMGYGHWSLPVVNFVLPSAVRFPDLDLYWRW